MDRRAFYIDGGWVAPATPHDYPVIDPSNEAPCATISLGTAVDADKAVAAAKAAFPFRVSRRDEVWIRKFGMVQRLVE